MMNRKYFQITLPGWTSAGDWLVMKTQKTSSKRSVGPKSSSTKSLTDMSGPSDNSHVVALAMYRFWLRMCQLSSPEKLRGNLIYLEKAHKENIRLCKNLRVK